MDETRLFDMSEIQDALALTTLGEVYDALSSKGYDPVSQIVGYLISGDAEYITNFNGARTKILELDRVKIVEALVKEYLSKE